MSEQFSYKLRNTYHAHVISAAGSSVVLKRVNTVLKALIVAAGCSAEGHLCVSTEVRCGHGTDRMGPE